MEDASTLIHKLDTVITKITKSKKFASVRILEEVRRELIVNGVPSSATAPVTAMAPLPIVAEPKHNGLAPYVPQNGEVDTLIRYITRGKNCLVTGGTGCGKTHLMSHVAALMGFTFQTIQGTEGAREEDIIGYPDLEAEDGASKRTFVEGSLPVAMQTENCLAYWDEPNMTPAGIQACMFSAMDYRRDLRLTQDKGRVIKAHDKFVVIGAMNEGVGYRGTSKLNDAMRDRFGCVIDLGYLTAEKEAQLLIDRTGVAKGIAEKLANAARQLRAAGERQEIKTPISTRSLIDCADGIVAGVDLHQALHVSLINKVSGTNLPERKAVADVLEAHFGKKGVK